MTDISSDPAFKDTPNSVAITHPLEPLTPEEIALAVQIIRDAHHLDERVRFVSVAHHEPPKETVLQFQPGMPIAREAFIVLLDKSTAFSQTYEAVVSITAGEVISWQHIPNVQPSITLDEFYLCEKIVKADAAFQAALARRGITDLDLVMVDPWSAGNYGAEEEQTRRILRAQSFVRADLKTNPEDNGYAHPIEGLLAVVDLNEMRVLRIDDYGVVPLPPQPGNYTPDAVPNMRTDLKPLEIAQPEGPSFNVEGHKVTWQNWEFRLGFTPREGLVLYTIGYRDQGRIRPIIYRAALAEMVVPYGDPHPGHSHQNAFDVGEYGVGWLANALELGCDCLGHIHYFDAHVTDSDGNVVTLPNAICMHEEDYGILWKHTNFRTSHVEVRRSRRLVVSFIATVGIYEYGFFWYFYQDGAIQMEIKLTGIMSTGAVAPGEKPVYGRLVAPQLNAIIHQHFFNVRMDMMVDGLHNSVYEEHLVSDPPGPENPLGNAFHIEATLLAKELEAQQIIDPVGGRSWKVVNPHVHNGVDGPVAYRLMPLDNAVLLAQPTSSIFKRAGFTTKNLWVTPYNPRELYPAGDYPNQHPGGAGLPEWTRANRDLVDTNVVLWYTVGVNHVPRPEDWPVMPVRTIGFMLQPSGFFDHNPALNVPPQH